MSTSDSRQPKVVLVGVCPKHGPYMSGGNYRFLELQRDEHGVALHLYGDGPSHPYCGCPEIVDYDGITCSYFDPDLREYVERADA